MKKTQWLIASLIAIMASMVMTGCGGSAGTPPPDSNTTTGGDDNTTEVAQNTKLTIQKSDLGDCQDMRVQVWALEYEAEANSKLFGLVEFAEGNITDEGGSYSVEIPADKIPQINFYHAHATVFCGEREWGMKSLSYEMDNLSQGFYKAQNSLIMMCVKTYPGNGESFPDELAPEFDTHRMVFAVSSSKSIDINSSDFDTFLSVDTGYEQYEAYTGQYTNNLITDLYHYDTDEDWEFDSFGYVDSGTKRMTSFNQKWVTAGIRYKNLKKTYTDIVKNPINGDFLWGIDRCPSYMQ